MFGTFLIRYCSRCYGACDGTCRANPNHSLDHEIDKNRNRLHKRLDGKTGRTRMKIDLKKFWTEKIVPYLENGKQELVLPAVEIYVEKMIEAKSDEIADKAASLVKGMIPGGVDDALIDSKLSGFKADLKKMLLVEAEKISDKV